MVTLNKTYNSRLSTRALANGVTGSFGSGPANPTVAWQGKQGYVVAHRIVWRFTLMISEKRIARNDIDEVKYVD
jgi:hypothetical protein